MSKKLLLTFVIAIALTCVLALSVFAAPQLPELGYEFGKTQTIDGFTPPSQKFVNTDERVLLKDGDNLVTYPAYYITGDSESFNVNFNALNSKTGKGYEKSSIVMLEIPDGITTIPMSCFSGTGYGSMVYVQLPGSITKVGLKAFVNNSIIVAVEFLDGEQELQLVNNENTWGDDAMFAASSSGSCSSLEYVRFPNNLTKIDYCGALFGKATKIDTIILGENCSYFDTLFGGSAPKGDPKYIYASEKLFADLSTMPSNIFGSQATYQNGCASIVLYYTGTQEQAEAFLAKGAELMTSNYVFKNTKLFDANNYDVNELNAFATVQRNEGQIAIVYNYNKCEAFYGGNHVGVEINGCLVECENCGQTTLKANPEHSNALSQEFAGQKFFSTASIKVSCANCGAVELEKQIAPVFYWVGYSAKTFGEYGFGQQYIINSETLDEYKAIMTQYGKKFSYGVVAAGASSNGNPLSVVDGEVAAKAGAQFITFDNVSYDAFFMNITGMTESDLDVALVCCAYVQLGDEIVYLDNNESVSTVALKSYNQIDAIVNPKEEE